MDGISSVLPQRKGIVIGGLVLIFGLPLALAWLVFHFHAGSFKGGLEHGELITPAQQFSPPPMINDQGEAISGDLFRGKWTLVYYNPAHKTNSVLPQTNPCDQHCLDLMDTLRRIRLAQDRAMREVRLVLVLPTSASPLTEGAKWVDSNIHVVTADHWPLAPGSVYIVDPQGFLVLRYPTGFEPTGLLKDLKHLLKLAGN
ncbi:hypothetical protein [Halothiobacillus neapolitanus]|uniref:Thioredoxin domain-containing protein n=1 Tax=Halothiobacillus neapolitanus (strain ATCC 23641 / DSM 15147 / CIP 104769 / NCIMB 8539 / c2) TaxID=555778 RepID=D0KXM4_HALNC|nr:hypothetical protein [Halothiobacillus neapolitanus]ACX97212.1 hypothetical protein Hneap_2403 [Halothiobacillus neapolitanus c2]TDN60347.1 cytochrome oxidase Cu insertion factor (SCO1/SenC/PrrC family) [Halothiobacillus neapolitanus]